MYRGVNKTAAIPPKNPIMIFTDGACSGNPGPGGWGVIILTPAPMNHPPDEMSNHWMGEVIELGGREAHTTNNRMELLAAIQGLEETRVYENQPIQVLTDSTYVISGITRWVWGWLKKGWLTAEGKDVVNVDLWQKLLRATQSRNIIWKHVRGHAGIVGNERADEIAVQFCRLGRADLFRGFFRDYGRDLRAIPATALNGLDLPKKSSNSAKKAYSYLSLIGGTPQRHTTWVDCERRVKGQTGAKFKKATSSEDELTILRAWGFPDGWPGPDFTRR